MNYDGHDWQGSLTVKEKPEALGVCCFDPVADEGKTPFTLVTHPDFYTPYVLVNHGVFHSLVTNSDLFCLVLCIAFCTVTVHTAFLAFVFDIAFCSW